jgi:hypothetical protein
MGYERRNASLRRARAARTRLGKSTEIERCEKVETGFSQNARSNFLKSITFFAFRRFRLKAA